MEKLKQLLLLLNPMFLNLREIAVKWLKELLRLITSAIVSYLLTEGVIASAVEIFGAQLDPTLKTQIILFLTAAIKSLDRALYSVAKDLSVKSLNPNKVVQWLSKGLFRF